MFKFDNKQIVYYLKDNIIHSAMINSRCYVDSIIESNLPKVFGIDRIQYSTVHGTFIESVVFATKQELIDSL